MKTIEQVALETFPPHRSCLSKDLEARYNREKMIKAVRKWHQEQQQEKPKHETSGSK